MLPSDAPFIVSANEGRWPNRAYFEILPGTPLFRIPEEARIEDKESYTDWLFAAVQTDEIVATNVRQIMEAIVDKKIVRLVVPNRNTDFRGAVILELINQYLETQQ